jgi:glycosyltransferase involved in cell wall biosynthesis
MKILIISEMSVPYAVGGGEVRYALLARELTRRGHDVTWLSMRQRNSPDHEVIAGVRHLHQGPRIASPPSRPLFAMLRFMFTAFFHILTHRYDIIDAQTYAPLPPVWLACLLSRQNMVATIHNVWHGSRKGLLPFLIAQVVPWIEAVIYMLPYNRVITVSQSTASTLVGQRGVKQRRIRIVPNGIDLAAVPIESPERPRDYDFVFVGRFVELKQIDHIIEAIGIVVREGRSIKVALVGAGPLLEEMIGHAAQAGLQQVIDFPGSVSNKDALAWMRRSKVYVHTSASEGFPVVMVEALACGTPVVAYGIPGVVEVVENGRTGLLVPSGDVQSLACTCQRLIEDEQLRRSFAAQGRRHVEEQLSLARMLDGIEAVYREASGA